jgi:hypothetical protein
MLLEMEGQQAARSLFELTDLTLDGFSPPPMCFFSISFVFSVPQNQRMNLGESGLANRIFRCFFGENHISHSVPL